MATKDDLESNINSVISNQKHFDDLSPTVEAAFKRGSAFAGALGAFWLKDHEDTAKKWIRTVLYGGDVGDIHYIGIVYFIKSFNLPVVLIDIANQWMSIQGNIDEGHTNCNYADITARWQSPGADSYETARKTQADAFQAASKICGTIADNINDMARNILKFYIEMANGVADFVSNIIVNVAAMTGPEVVSAAEHISDIITSGAKMILNAILSAIDVTKNVQIGLNVIEQNFTQVGLKNQLWPDPGCQNFMDASVADGHANWSVKSDRYYQ
ncbi:hypothetical protein [Nocardia sp. CDC160]|uniref:hypothetical protein n=1 Tax=Nocardia sp. CDC160 TaxID=3112166 RepID=UPI002DBE00E4|nr:hypothetical protein [Nocardia sp. CDC160]MEC3916024.1 hypothetical protein [Nocardia sp. CDC160]